MSQLRKRFFWIALLLIPTWSGMSLLSAQALPQGTVLGVYHVTTTKAIQYNWDGVNWNDLLSHPRVGFFPAKFELKSFNLKAESASVCISGMHGFGDYGWTDFDTCTSGPLVSGFNFWRSHFWTKLHFFPDSVINRSTILLASIGNKDTLAISFSLNQDTLSTSLYWITMAGSANKVQLSIPGSWDSLLVTKTCSLTVQQNPQFQQIVLNLRTYFEQMTITRYEFKLTPGTVSLLEPTKPKGQNLNFFLLKNSDALGRSASQKMTPLFITKTKQ